MKAGLALLVDATTHNLVRPLALELHRCYGTGLLAARLPAHISLKQPFEVNDLAALEGFFDTFAAGIAPVELLLSHIEVLAPPGPEGPLIAWVAVAENLLLRELHKRLNHELEAALGDTHAPFDGDDYRFHLTLSFSQPAPAGVAAMLQEWHGRRLNHRTVARSLVLFISDEEEHYMSYRIAEVT